MVTGASRGIGRSIAIQLAEEGYKVAVNYAGNKEKADAVVEEIKAKGVEAFAIQANVANGDEVKAMIKLKFIIINVTFLFREYHYSLFEK